MTDTNNPAQLDEVHESDYEIESMPDETTTTDKSYSQGQLVLRRFVRRPRPDNSWACHCSTYLRGAASLWYTT